jgi:hypothetical protein
MNNQNKEKKGNPIPVRFYPSTEDLLRKLSQQQDRSINYIVEREVRKSLGLEIPAIT